jgi:hypothetical protein
VERAKFEQEQAAFTLCLSEARRIL